MSGLMIAAPASGSGKTTVTLGLMRALTRRGVRVAPGKAGPDYIDPAFHAAASGRPCLNYDPWAMRTDLMRANAARSTTDHDMLVVEAMMGLHDGALDGTGTPADLAALLGLPVVMVIDCSRMAQSVAALVRGYADHRHDVSVSGVILNKVGSDRHERMLRDALDRVAMPVFGALRRDDALRLPERHLGLVQAGEHHALDAFIEHAAQRITEACNLDALIHVAEAGSTPVVLAGTATIPPPGARIAVARDDAFAFSYEHLLVGWRDSGATISLFSPLADEAPACDADAVYLPGGYPELHAGRLAGAQAFRTGMTAARDRSAVLYGECGGYMVLGEALVAADGVRYPMLGLLPLVTSFAERRRHLGYRVATPGVDGFFVGGPVMAHEFHYATIVFEGDAEPLFHVRDAMGDDLGRAGLRRSNVAGSFLHLIDLAA